MKKSIIFTITFFICIFIFFLSISIGSVNIPISKIFSILSNKLFHTALNDDISKITTSIVINIRLPRTIMAFLVGAALAVSGTVMQSILRNPLASSYTLGVSSGASLGAAIVMISGISFLGNSLFLTPIFAFIFGLGTVFLAIIFTNYLDQNIENQTIILVGMVLSLFVNAILSMITALSAEYIQKLVFWQMGSFASKEWPQIWLTLIVVFICFIFLFMYVSEMDILTFGEDYALSSGVNVKKVKLILLIFSSLLTGVSVAFCGTIGFIDLISPHVVRKIYGSSHKIVLPMSALFGGAFMILSDLISRTLLAPKQLPIGAITALIGAPFFTYIYFSKHKMLKKKGGL